MARARNARRPPREPCIGHRRRGPTCARRYLPALIQTASLVSKRGEPLHFRASGGANRVGERVPRAASSSTQRLLAARPAFSPTAPWAPFAPRLIPLRRAAVIRSVQFDRIVTARVKSAPTHRRQRAGRGERGNARESPCIQGHNPLVKVSNAWDTARSERTRGRY